MTTFSFIVEAFDIKTRTATPEHITISFSENLPSEEHGLAIMRLRETLSEIMGGARVLTELEYTAENDLTPRSSGLVANNA